MGKILQDLKYGLRMLTKSPSFPISAVLILTVAAGLAARPALAGDAQAGGEDFYIVSTVDLNRKQIVLKRPTEVTVLMQVTDKTAFTNLEGKRIQLKDLRAGDTVFARAVTDAQGKLVASSIRIGIMTQRELYNRYLKGIPLSPGKS
ncbi:MAG: hypothetical protein DMG22_02570 [Acidobacteria bacterium]|nr:MAG: hypothetical protein DMG22_02570 [Acidobacteriota bacterium]